MFRNPHYPQYPQLFIALPLVGLALLAPVHTAMAQVVPVVGATMALPSPLNLTDAISIGLRQQPQGYLARTQQTQASGQKTIARAQYLPVVTPSYQFQRVEQNRYGAGSAYVINTGSGGAQTVSTSSLVNGGSSAVTVSQTIFDSGAREVANAQARRGIEIADYGLADTRQQIILSITTSYYNLLRQIDQVKVAQADVERYQQTVALTRAQASTGTAAQKDVLQAEASLASAQITLIQVQNAVRTASATLKNAMGIVVGDIVQPAPLPTSGETTVANSLSLPALPATADTSQPLEVYLQEAYAKRPDLKGQQATLSSQELSVRSAKITAGLQVSGTYNYTYTPTNDLGSRGTGSTLLGTVSYPLFDGSSRRAAVRVAEAQRDAAKDQLEQDRQNVRLNVETYFVQRSEALQRTRLAQVAIRAAQTNYEAAVASRRAGVATILDVTTAQATLTTTLNQYVSAVYDYYIAEANLNRATGNLDETTAR